jgi:hypothetical protein
MSREAIEVGAFTWSRIQRFYDGDAVTHWQRCESEGRGIGRGWFDFWLNKHEDTAPDKVAQYVRWRKLREAHAAMDRDEAKSTFSDANIAANRP